ncbi:MAG: HAD family phosphatase [Maledivibacter sp.]|nr:HAD family phosphatase [Maledivibacter sp.]
MMKAVIFDMDGVIIDSEPIYTEADKKIFEKLSIDMSKEEIESYVGKNSYDMWTEVYEKYGLQGKFSINELVKYQRKMFLEHLNNSEKLSTISGVIDWMQYFKDNGIKMAIASSSSKEIVSFVIDKFKLREYIEIYVDGDSVKKGKPNPDIFLKAASELGIEPNECIVIEDSYNGVRAAKSAGMKCLGFKNLNSGDQDLSLGDNIIHSYSKKNLNKVINLFDKR